MFRISRHEFLGTLATVAGAASSAALLKASNLSAFAGWAIVKLDRVPDKNSNAQRFHHNQQELSRKQTWTDALNCSFEPALPLYQRTTIA
jgi:hypothetical protein